MPKDTLSPIPVSPETLSGWLETGAALLVDVRETREYDAEYIPGALLMPLSSFEPERLPVLGAIPLVLHCAVGKRSLAAARMLLNAGHPRVLHLEGGLDAWKAAGLDTEGALEG